MSWWIWVSLALTWVVLSCGGALWLGASARVVRRKEYEAAHRWGDDAVESQWRDVA